jgi:hypothetical protein
MVFLMTPPDFDPEAGFPARMKQSRRSRPPLLPRGPEKVVFLSTVGAQVAGIQSAEQFQDNGGGFAHRACSVAFLRAASFMEKCQLGCGSGEGPSCISQNRLCAPANSAVSAALSASYGTRQDG